MEKTLDCIFGRRSIRKYTEEPVSDENLDLLLRAAMAAPSAVAKDPWRFIVVRELNTRKEITKALPNGQMLLDAPVGIVVCGDINIAHSNELSYMLQDCSAAIENLLLASYVIGLGTVWLGVHPRMDRVNKIKDIFSLPENIIPISVIAIGHPAEEKDARTRYNRDYVHYEKWEE